MMFQRQPSSRLNRRRSRREDENVHRRPNLLEPLETRRMLTTLTGGGYDGDGQPISTVYDFRDSKDEIIRIIVGGDTEAEFVGAVFDEETGAMTLGDLVPAPVGDDDPTAELPGSELFAIYVTESDERSFISVAGLDEEANPPEVRPFEGNVTLTVRDLQDNGNWTSLATDDGTGVAFLGARSPAIEDVDNSEDRPILSGRLTDPIGVLPLGSGRTLRAGLTIANGNDFGRFLFGGTISGRVRATGSVDQFYAGMILTGDTRGAGQVVNNNFRVDGDLRDLVVLGSVGTMEEGEGNPLDEPRYLTGFQLAVRGQLGQFNARNALYGGGLIRNVDRNEIRTPQYEVEARGTELVNSIRAAGPYNWERGYVDSPAFFNDTYDTAQYIGTIDDDVRVRGTLQAIDDDDFDDFADYYAFPLLAGQTISAWVESNGFAQLGVFDPDGRLIASDYSDVDPLAVRGSQVRFTADRPGVYRFAIATVGDGDFDGPGGEFDATEIGITPYDLRIAGTGELGVGGIVAGGNLFNHTANSGFELRNGDFGAIVAGGTLLSTAAQTVNVRAGNLRAIQGDAVGLLKGDRLTLGADLFIPRGALGLARSTGGILVVNPLLAATPIGRDVQMLDAATTFYGNILTKGNLGVLRAGDMATRSPSSITVNSDQRGRDGIIDLIDIQGDLGTLQGGGPWITTGPSGNVRYFNVEGTVYRDLQFGGGSPQNTQFNPGESVTLNDDSGATVEITPGSDTDSLEVLTYGIRGSGGVAIIRVESTGGLNIDSEGRARNAGVEFGKIISTGAAGAAPYLRAGGDLPVDILNLQGLNFGDVVNSTDGEIVSILAESIARLEAENLGVARARVAPAVQQRAITIADLHPFHQLRGGIIVGDIDHLEADDAMGNIVASPALAAAAFGASSFTQLTGLTPDFADNVGNINTIIADGDRKRTKSSFEGIAAPIYAAGDIGQVNPGAGIAPSGTGHGSQAGLYAQGRIGSIRGVPGTEIRGNIVSNTAIDSIRLPNGGSIINANIMVGDLEDAREYAFPRTLTSDNDSITDPTYEIGEIMVTNTKSRAGRKGARGNPGGGIIGAYIQGPDIGGVLVDRGFGILNSTFSAPGNGVMKGIRADGYGIRDVSINAGAMLGELVAEGNGKNLRINTFSPAVRLSEKRAVDPFFNAPPSRLTDLHEFFGSNGSMTVRNVTRRGMIAGVDARGSRDLGLLKAWQVRGSTSNTTSFPNVFNFANSIREIDVRRDVLNAEIVTGALDELNVGRHANRLNLTVAGTIDTIDIGGNLGSTSSILASGPDGQINLIRIGNDLNGFIRATDRIGRLQVGGEINGEVIADGQPVQES